MGLNTTKYGGYYSCWRDAKIYNFSTHIKSRTCSMISGHTRRDNKFGRRS
jgi:hypothetical protein